MAVGAKKPKVLADVVVRVTIDMVQLDRNWLTHPSIFSTDLAVSTSIFNENSLPH